MGSSPRHLHAQSAKLTRGKAVGGCLVIACMVPLLLAGLPGDTRPRSAPLVDESTWLGVATKMETEASVPSRELLGAPIRSAHLKRFLEERDIDLDSFRLTAERIRENAIRAAFAEDDRTETVLADMPEMPDIALPDGVHLSRYGSRERSASSSNAPRLAPELRCARRLIDSLAAPLKEDD